MEDKYGLLLNQDIKLHRMYFAQMLKLIGINVIYRSPKKDKHWTTYTEIDSNYNEPILTGCIFDNHPDQKTMKKLGWVHELTEGECLIHVPYNLPNIQVGALFIVPSGLDDGKGRLFRVVQMTNGIIYPASITCQIVPELEDTFEKSNFSHSDNSFNLMNEDGDGNL